MTEQRDEMTPGRDLEQVGDLIDGVVASLGGRVGLGPAVALWAEWREIAGPDWARSTPANLDRGVLLVTVPNGLEATRLRYATGALKARIEERLGPGVVSSVRVRVKRRERGSR